MGQISVTVNEEFSLHNFLLPALQTLVAEKGLNTSPTYPGLSFEITGLKPRSQSYTTNIDVVVKLNGIPFCKGQTYYHMYCDTNLHAEMTAVHHRIFDNFHTWPSLLLPEDCTEQNFRKFVEFCYRAKLTTLWFADKFRFFAMYKNHCEKIEQSDIEILKAYANDIYEDEDTLVLERDNDIKLIIAKKANGYVFGSTGNKGYARKKLVDAMGF